MGWNSLVTYAVTFSKDMDESILTAADFVNASTAPITGNDVSEAMPGVISVDVMPTGSGTL